MPQDNNPILYFNDGTGHVRQVPADKVETFRKYFPKAVQATEDQLSEIEGKRATQSEQEGRTTITAPKVPKIDTSGIGGGVSLPKSAPI